MQLIGYLVMASVVCIVFIGFVFWWIKIRISTKNDHVINIQQEQQDQDRQRQNNREENDLENNADDKVQATHAENSEISATADESNLSVSFSILWLIIFGPSWKLYIVNYDWFVLIFLKVVEDWKPFTRKDLITFV